MKNKFIIVIFITVLLLLCASCAGDNYGMTNKLSNDMLTVYYEQNEESANVFLEHASAHLTEMCARLELTDVKVPGTPRRGALYRTHLCLSISILSNLLPQTTAQLKHSIPVTDHTAQYR